MKRRCVPKKIDKYYSLSFLIILIIVLGYLCFHDVLEIMYTREKNGCELQCHQKQLSAGNYSSNSWKTYRNEHQCINYNT